MIAYILTMITLIKSTIVVAASRVKKVSGWMSTRIRASTVKKVKNVHQPFYRRKIANRVTFNPKQNKRLVSVARLEKHVQL